MVHRVPKCKVDTIRKCLSWCYDVISVQQMSIIFWIFLYVYLHVLWVPFYMQVKPWVLFLRNHPFLCVCVGDVPSVCLRVWLHTCVQVHVEGRDQPWAPSSRSYPFSCFEARSLTRSRWLGEARCLASPRDPACSLSMLELQACATLTGFLCE